MPALLAIPILVGLAFAAVALILGGISVAGMVTFLFIHPFLTFGIIVSIAVILFLIKK